MGKQTIDPTKAAALYMLKNGLASYKEIDENRAGTINSVDGSGGEGCGMSPEEFDSAVALGAASQNEEGAPRTPGLAHVMFR